MIDSGQVVAALTAGIPSIVLGFLAYRRSRKVDAVAAQTVVSSESRAGTGQIIEGLNAMIDNYQEDNAALRAEAKYLTGRITEIIARCDEKKQQLDETKRQLSALRRKYGENGVSS